MCSSSCHSSGKARAKQDELGDASGDKVLPVLFHGDAAFAGQGVVFECLNLMELEGYKVGGTIHVVVNNQVECFFVCFVCLFNSFL